MKLFVTIPEISVWLDAPGEEHIVVETSWDPPMFAGFNIKKPDELWAKEIIPKLSSYSYRDRYIDPLIEELKEDGGEGDVVVINFETMEYFDHEDQCLNPIVHFQEKVFGSIRNGTNLLGLDNEYPIFVEIPYDSFATEFKFRCLDCNRPLVSRTTFRNPYNVGYLRGGLIVRSVIDNFSAVVCKCGTRYDATPLLENDTTRLIPSKPTNQPELF